VIERGRPWLRWAGATTGGAISVLAITLTSSIW
jgi:hypothetical protein